MCAEPASYGPSLAKLLSGARTSELGPGVAVASERDALAALSVEELVAPHRLVSRDMALACLAGLWLRYDFLDESHGISQDLENPTGSLWHGILHRREGDFSNAKYWFRRVGRHPVYEPLAAAAHDLSGRSEASAGAASVLESSDWDPLGFVDLCQQALAGPAPLRSLCEQVQKREWELLFDYCYRQAIGESHQQR